MRKKIIALIASISLLFTGCELINKAGKSAGEGLTKGLNTDSLGAGLARGVQKGFADSLSHREFTNALDSLIYELGGKVNKQVVNIEDSVLNAQLTASLVAIKNSLLGDATKQQLLSIVSALKNNILGAGTRQQVNELVSGVIRQLGSDSTQLQIKKIRDIIIGDDTKRALTAMADSIAEGVIQKVNTELNPTIKGDVRTVDKDVEWLLVLVAVLAIIIIGFVWYKKRQYEQMLTLVTNQIHETPDQKSYDELTQRIRKKAQASNLEKPLRKLLSDQGILGADTWVH